VQNVLVSDGSLDFLTHPEDPAAQARFQNTSEHLSNMRDVLRTNVYGMDGTVIWSSDRKLIGRKFADNDELDEAKEGELVVHAGRITADSLPKGEYEGLSPSVAFFVETYVPVKLPDGKGVAGVVELYKAPLALTQAIHDGRERVARCAIIGAVALFLSLFWLIRRADSTIRAQHGKLIEAETLGAIGELAASVAHNIRNPLASIRSSAELSLESPEEHGAECARDILREVDRVSGRITELLSMTNHGHAEPRRIELAQLLRECVSDHQEGYRRREQTLTLDNQVPQAAVSADARLLKQVFHSLLANASEAMDAGQGCVVTVRESGPDNVRIEIVDQGSGIEPEFLGNVTRPFFTTKPQGLGLGLPLAKRIVQRHGGQFSITSRAGAGTSVRIELPRA
jgi:signal transduction histidine kinase